MNLMLIARSGAPVSLVIIYLKKREIKVVEISFIGRSLYFTSHMVLFLNF